MSCKRGEGKIGGNAVVRNKSEKEKLGVGQEEEGNS